MLVGITETWLDESVSTPSLAGYTLISRLDRRDGRQGGGVMLFARSDAAHTVVHIADSLESERSWHIFHSDTGPVSICLWYRPPRFGETDSSQRVLFLSSLLISMGIHWTSLGSDHMSASDTYLFVWRLLVAACLDRPKCASEAVVTACALRSRLFRRPPRCAAARLGWPGLACALAPTHW